MAPEYYPPLTTDQQALALVAVLILLSAVAVVLVLILNHLDDNGKKRRGPWSK